MSEKQANLSVDFAQIAGGIKPMQGAGQPPRTGESLQSGELLLPENSCVEIKLFDL